MSLKKIPYKQLKTLIKKHLSEDEFPETKQLIIELSKVKERGYLKKSELVIICKWKSPRAIHHIKSNSSAKVKSISGSAFNTKSEKLKLELLTSLKGVSVPMASAILMLTDPKEYAVIDIRVWQLLYKMKSVNKNPKGKGFDFNQWYEFLNIIRYYARVHKVTTRDIERTLFIFHRDNQKGTLY